MLYDFINFKQLCGKGSERIKTERGKIPIFRRNFPICERGSLSAGGISRATQDVRIAKLYNHTPGKKLFDNKRLFAGIGKKPIENKRLFTVSGKKRIDNKRLFTVSGKKPIDNKRLFTVSGKKRIDNKRLFTVSGKKRIDNKRLFRGSGKKPFDIDLLYFGWISFAPYKK